MIPPVPVSRVLLLGLVAAGAIAAIATPQPTSSFAGGFAAGAGAAFVVSFLSNPRRVLTRDQITDRVWGYDFGPTSNPLEVYVGYLRRKTEADGEPRLLHTVRGVGYVLREGPGG